MGHSPGGGYKLLLRRPILPTHHTVRQEPSDFRHLLELLWCIRLAKELKRLVDGLPLPLSEDGTNALELGVRDILGFEVAEVAEPNGILCIKVWTSGLFHVRLHDRCLPSRPGCVVGVGSSTASADVRLRPYQPAWGAENTLRGHCTVAAAIKDSKARWVVKDLVSRSSASRERLPMKNSTGERGRGRIIGGHARFEVGRHH